MVSFFFLSLIRLSFSPSLDSPSLPPSFLPSFLSSCPPSLPPPFLQDPSLFPPSLLPSLAPSLSFRCDMVSITSLNPQIFCETMHQLFRRSFTNPRGLGSSPTWSPTVQHSSKLFQSFQWSMTTIPDTLKVPWTRWHPQPRQPLPLICATNGVRPPPRTMKYRMVQTVLQPSETKQRDCLCTRKSKPEDTRKPFLTSLPTSPTLFVFPIPNSLCLYVCLSNPLLSASLTVSLSTCSSTSPQEDGLPCPAFTAAETRSRQGELTSIWQQSGED